MKLRFTKYTPKTYDCFWVIQANEKGMILLTFSVIFRHSLTMACKIRSIDPMIVIYVLYLCAKPACQAD
jgi:hypothetical protein